MKKIFGWIRVMFGIIRFKIVLAYMTIRYGKENVDIDYVERQMSDGSSVIAYIICPKE